VGALERAEDPLGAGQPLEPGDRVTFFPVDAKTFAEQDRAAEAGEIVADLMSS